MCRIKVHKINTMINIFDFGNQTLSSNVIGFLTELIDKVIGESIPTL